MQSQAATGRRLTRPSDILKFPLIHMDSRADWSMAPSGGLENAEVIHGPVLNGPAW